ncbi:MAG: ribokinase [Actinobacteria bacterium]|nr:ribokinase [Actinomycetota bacterium]
MVVGSSNIDMIAYAQRLPEKGETVYGDSFALGFGGKGANQAVMSSRLGANVHMVNTLGDDVFGETTIANYHEQGIDTSYIARVAGSSGVAPIWVEPDGTNRIIIVPGANNAMTPAQGVNAINTIADIDVVIGQLEIPQAVTAAAFAAAQARGIPTILNPAPYVPLIAELLAASDWIMPNESEFAAFHPRNLLPESDEIIQELANHLHKKLVVTLGAAGAAWCSPQGQVQRVAAPKVVAIDSTGAGDAFVGAFAYGIAAGMEEITAINLGCLCASDSVTRKGTQSSYPTKEQASALIIAAAKQRA